MFARLILALLLAAFAIPAMAAAPACHDAPMTAGMAGMAEMGAPMAHAEHKMPRDRDHATVPHVCIGCIPPASLASRSVDAPRVTAALPRRIVSVAFAPNGGSAPTLPPPRRIV